MPCGSWPRLALNHKTSHRTINVWRNLQCLWYVNSSEYCFLVMKWQAVFWRNLWIEIWIEFNSHVRITLCASVSSLNKWRYWANNFKVFLLFLLLLLLFLLKYLCTVLTLFLEGKSDFLFWSYMFCWLVMRIYCRRRGRKAPEIPGIFKRIGSSSPGD